MEVVALHEQLRRAFAPVLKVLRSPPLAAVATPSPTAAAANATKKPVKHSPKAHAEPRENGSAAPLPPSSSTMMDVDTSAVDAPLPSAPAIAIAIAPPAGQSLPLLPEPALTAPQEPSAAPQQLVRIDRFKQHCLTVVHRLNTYQYGSKQVFCQELAQLALVVNSPAQQQALGALAERVAALDVPDALDGSMSRGRQVLGSLEFDASAAIPGLQEVTGDASGAANAKKWLVNVNVKDQSIPVGSFLTRENALQAYELFRFDLNTSRGGAATVYKLAEQLALDQRASDAQVLDAATNACHTHMSWQRLHDMISLSTGPERETTPTAPAVTTPVKPAQPLSQRASGSSKTTPSSPRSPVASSPPSSPTAGTTPSKSKNPKRKKTAHRLAHLRLRRLMQIRLCPHLQGQPVCVIRRTGDEVEGVDWTPTGRLEAGKVFSFKHGKLVTFADFVSDELRHPISACPHIYVVKTRESIDSHLVHCDAFSEDDRLLLGKDFGAAIKKYTKAGEAKGSSSSSRRR